jgi:hypothetical protein
MHNPKTLARICGGIYLLLIITGIFSLVYMPSSLIDWDSPSTTISNIKNSELFFRAGILSGLVCFTCYIALPLCLYHLFKETDKSAVLWMLALSIPSVPITFSSYVKLVDVLSLISDARYADMLTATALEAQVMYLLTSHNNASMIAGAFWGLWLFPFGYLVIKSAGLPRLLGICLIIGGAGYLIDLVGKLIFGLETLPFYISLPGTIGEFGTCLWLLILGIKRVPSASAPSQLTAPVITPQPPISLM